MYPAFLVAVVGAIVAMVLAQEPPAPGVSKTTRTKVLEAGAEMLQSEAPLSAIHAHVCGFHFYNGEPERQVIAHHYCSHLSDEVMQCVIYDSDKTDARLIGIEYIISGRLFATLPADEKKLWHSHVYEVKSGQLIAPRLPDAAEEALMKDLVGTYGKTIHTWQIDVHKDLPLGAPQLMMGFVADGQANRQLIEDRDRGYGISTAEKKASRADVTAPAVAAGADGWKDGQAVQLEFKAVEKGAGAREK